jgi:hypothetical protein
MNLKIQCAGPGSAEEVQGILEDAFRAITPLLSEIDQHNLGMWEIKFPSLNHLSGTISLGQGGEGDNRLWLEMEDDVDGHRIVDSVLWPHDLEEEEGDAQEEDSDEEDTDDSDSNSDASDVSSSSSNSEISAATLQMLTQTTPQMTMLATAMILLHSSLLLRIAQLHQVQLTQLLGDLDSESGSEDAESDIGGVSAERTEEGKEDGA